ncbi:MAG TPA: tripartite tricarboxylate transporter substrate-binding protein [Burkholderiales bacterium]|nr:tripartite tricarboxylate transporter substrate-binding protein [Burkholderiales bacterium]
MKTKVALVLAIAAMAAGLPFGVAHGASFEGKTITIVVGFKAGGGYDRVARVLARHIPKYLPGNPNVIVQNMPGANSITAANHVYAVAKPDGLTIGTFNRNLILAQLTNVRGVKFDQTKFAWIGSAASESTVLAIRTDLPYQTFDELRKSGKQVVIGATGPGANTYDFPLLLKEFLGVDLKIVSGYSSSSDIMLAIERKEVDARAGSYTSIRPFIDRGLVRPLIRGSAIEPGIEKLPVDEQLAPTPRARAIMALRSAPEVVGRPYVMPPGTPEDIVKAMRAAFDQAIKDPQLKAEAKKGKMDLEFMPGDEALKVIKEVLSQPKDVVDEFSKYIKFGE